MSLFSVTQTEIDTPKPVMALIVNKSRAGLAITRHVVSETASGPLIGAGTNLATSDLRELTDILRNDADSRQGKLQLLGRRILAKSASEIVWLMPAAVRPMWFRHGSKPVALDVPWPNLIVGARKGALWVAAVKTTRITGDTRLFHSPLMNVYANCSVCLGSATPPRDGGEVAAIAGWESVLTDTLFAHTNHNRTLALGDEVSTADHFAFWQSLAKQKARKFPHDKLVSCHLTVSAFLRSVGG